MILQVRRRPVNRPLFVGSTTPCNFQSLQGSQWPALLLPETLRHAYIRETERIFGSVLVLLTWLFLPTTFVLTGEVSKLLASGGSERTVIISNHMNFTDWWYLWHLAWMLQRHGDVKIVLRGDLRRIPVFGIGCDFFKFTWVNFGKFKSSSGQSPMAAFTESINRYLTDPFFLMIFPEGTLIYPKNLDKSREFAASQSLPFEQSLTLLPKHSGLHSTIETLEPDRIWDLTIGYGDVLPTEMPFDIFPVPFCFFRPPLPGGPSRFHIHAREIARTSIPGFGGQPGSAPLKPAGASGPYSVPAEEVAKKSGEEQFALWLRELWLEKEKRLARFYRDGWSFAKGVDEEVAVELYGASEKESASTSELKEIEIAPGAQDLVEIFGWCGLFSWAGWIGVGYFTMAAGKLLIH